MTTTTHRRDILARIADDPRQRIDQARLAGAAARGELGVQAYCISHDLDTCPSPIDVTDLLNLFQTDPAAAWEQLARLTDAQLHMQALAVAAARDLDPDAVLSRWQTVLSRRAEG